MTGAVLRRRLSGVLFLAVIAGLVGLTVALYQKAFTPVVEVSLETDRIGNQLSAPADVKLRGLIVGEVREVRTGGDGATVELALDPERVDLVPSDVKAQLLPKTLFGEKFVNLVAPEDSTARPLREGDVIPQDRSEVALETQQVLDDLQPLLQTLRPQELSTTLNAVSGALRGRGERVGANLQALDAYLAELNPEVPGIQENIRRLADLATTYDQAAPDLLGLLDELSAVNRNLVDQREELATFLASTSGSVSTLDEFLRENERRLVRLAADSRLPLELYARYSPEFPCLAQGLARSDKIIGDTFGGKQPGLHITLEPTQDQNRYEPGDEPQYRDQGAPFCWGLPDPEGEAGDDEFRDGYRDAERSGLRKPQQDRGGVGAQTSSDVTPLQGPQGQSTLLKALTAPALGVPSDEVPDLVDLLFGPLARGTTVRIS